MSMRQPSAREPLPYRPHGLVVASYAEYVHAQLAVDRLSDDEFPVEQVAIVGSDLRLVEQVTGRLTRGRVVGAGALSGAWFGLFVGLLLGLFTTDGSLGGWIQVVLVGAAFGALWGLVLAWFGYNATGGTRDFSSRSGVVAERYDVVVHGPRIDDARQRLLTFATEGGPPLVTP
jgi:MFS family permease